MFHKSYVVQLDCGHDVKVNNYDNSGEENLLQQVRAAFAHTVCPRCKEETKTPHVIAMGMAT